MLTTASAVAGSRAVQSACFAPEALRALPGERRPVKGDRDFDKLPEAQLSKPAGSTLQAPIDAALRGAIRRVDLPKGLKLIALTLDLCEQRGEVAGYDGEIFDTLRRENVKATLFAGGKWMRSHVARTQQLMSDPLFELANHSETHRNMRLLETAAVASEIAMPQRTFEVGRQKLAATQCAAAARDGLADIPLRMSLFRFPFGACNAASMAAVNDAGLLAVQWDVSTGDPDPSQSAAEIANAMVRNVRAGSIIIAHGNGRGWNTAAALPLAIPKLKAMGYEFVTVSELLARGKPVIAATCYNARPGDTDRYDFVGGLRRKPNTAIAQSKASEALPWATTTEPIQRPRQSRSPKKEAPGQFVPSSSWPF
jgi:peptidoglycan-N-acetylglucosamine deacetylase